MRAMSRSFTLFVLGLATIQLASAVLTGPICPASNSTQYRSYGRRIYNITCGVDHTNSDLTSATTSTFQACIELCDNTSSCTAATFTGASGGAGSGTCYMKSGLPISAASATANVNSASYSSTLPALSCPGTDTQTYDLTNGAQAVMECFQDHNGGDASMTITSTMEACIILCGNTNGCVAVSYAPGSGGFCYLKNTLNTAVMNYGVWGARITSNSTTAITTSFTPGCPQSNGTTVLDNNGASFVVECGMDRPGGDYQQINVGSLIACMSACSNQVACVDVSWVPGLSGKCYLKTSQLSSVLNSAVWGARLVANETLTPTAYSDYAQCATSFISGSSGCGKAYPSMFTPGNAGSLTSSIPITLADGEIRYYTMFLPIQYSISKPSPVIFGFHGNGNSPGSLSSVTGWQNNTLNTNTITVYPAGVGQKWQGAPYSTVGIDDISFMKQLINYISQNFCVDPTRLYATGQSNGGGFVGTLACDPVASQMFAAYGASSAALYNHIAYNSSCPASTAGAPAGDPYVASLYYPCAPYRKRMPFMEVHGLLDGTIPYYGGNHNGECIGAVTDWVHDFVGRENYTSGITNVTTALYNSSNQIMAYQYQFGTGSTLGQVVHYMIPWSDHPWDDGSVANGQGFNTGTTMFNWLKQWTLLNA